MTDDQASFEDSPSALTSPSIAKRGQGGRLSDRMIEEWAGCVDKSRPMKLSDGNGLFVHQRTPGGSKVFRVRLPKPGGDFTLGQFPDISIESARKSADDARRLAIMGSSPTVFRKLQIARQRIDNGATFGTIAELWLQEHIDANVWTAKYVEEQRGKLHNWVQPQLLWQTPMRRATNLLGNIVIDKCAASSPSVATKLLGLIRNIARYAVDKTFVSHSSLTQLSPSVATKKYRADSKKKGNNLPRHS